MRRSVMLLLAAAALLGATATSVQADLTPINVPSDTDTLQAAIDRAQVGVNYVLVEDTYTYGPVVMKGGVPVLAAEGNTPVIDAGTSTAIAADWPSDATSATVLDGFVIRGGTSTVVRVRGSGIIRNCEVDDQGSGDPEVGIESAGTTLIQDNTVYMGGDDCTGILATGGQCTIEGCDVLVSNYRGIYAEDGTIQNNHVRVMYGVGIWLDGGSITVSQNHVELYSGYESIGIDVWGGDADYLIEDCLVESSGGAAYGMLLGVSTDAAEIRRVTVVGFDLGFWGNGEGSGVHHCIASSTTYAGFADLDAQYCIAEVFDTGTQGTGSVAEDPLFCNLNGSQYTLRVDSYGNPENNASGELIGAFPVACMYGTLQRDSEYAGDGALEFPGDLTIPTDKRLTLASGTIVDVAGADSLAGGTSTTQTELIVNGRLEVNGAEGDTVRFRSVEPSPGEDDWLGIIVSNESANVSMSYAEVRHAGYGVSISNADTAVTIQHSRFADNAYYDIQTSGSDTSMAITLSNNKIDVGGGTGIRFEKKYGTISGNEITGGSGTGTRGIYVNLAGSLVEIAGNTVSGFDNGYGLEVGTGDPIVTGNTFSDNKYGLYLHGGAPDIGVDSTSAANTISGNTRGISTTCTGSGSCPTCSGFAPRIRNCNITENYLGVVTEKRGSLVNLGEGGDRGVNNLYDNTLYCVWNRSTCANDEVWAIGNYWGGCDGNDFPVVCWDGDVLVDYYKCTGPDAFHPPMGIVEVKPFRVLGVVPSPVTRTARVQFAIGSEGARVGVRIFDVSGRLVRTIQEQHVNPGVHEMQWDGRTEEGALAGSGLYFVRVTANDREHETVKVLVLR